MGIWPIKRYNLWAHLAFPALAALAVTPAAGRATPCAFGDPGEPETRVSDIVDGRSFHLDDGREVRLAGIETSMADARARDALAALIDGRDITLRNDDDTPDRYGRQTAFAFVAGSELPVQRELLAQGAALVAAETTEKDCANLLAAAESEARVAHRGIWAASVIKNAESPDDILSGIGRFTVVEGRVLSVRQTAATTYLNFGRNWTRGFAVIISRRVVPVLEAAGLAVKSLENQRIRVRGWVEARGGAAPGPRIELSRPAQIELLGTN